MKASPGTKPLSAFNFKVSSRTSPRICSAMAFPSMIVAGIGTLDKRGKDDLFDGTCLPRLFVDLNHDRAHPDVVFRKLEFVRRLVLESLDRNFLFQSDHRIVRSRHPDIRDVGRPFREDAGVGGWDMGM